MLQVFKLSTNLIQFPTDAKEGFRFSFHYRFSSAHGLIEVFLDLQGNDGFKNSIIISKLVR